jgi:hypothetical protein
VRTSSTLRSQIKNFACKHRSDGGENRPPSVGRLSPLSTRVSLRPDTPGVRCWLRRPHPWRHTALFSTCRFGNSKALMAPRIRGVSYTRRSAWKPLVRTLSQLYTILSRDLLQYLRRIHLRFNDAVIGMNSPLPFVPRAAKARGMARPHSSRHPLFNQRWFDDIITTSSALVSAF